MSDIEQSDATPTWPPHGKKPFGTAMPSNTYNGEGFDPYYTSDFYDGHGQTSTSNSNSNLNSNSNSSNNNSSGGSGSGSLSKTAVGGIVVGAAVLALLAALLAFLCLRRRRRQRQLREDTYQKKEAEEASLSMSPQQSLHALALPVQRPRQQQRAMAQPAGGGGGDDDMIALTKTHGSSFVSVSASVPDDPPSYEEAESSNPQRNVVLAMGAVSNGFRPYSFHPSPDVDSKTEILPASVLPGTAH